MGAWSEGSFENDTACDWTYSFEESPGLRYVSATINAVLNDDDDASLDSEIGAEGVAACEVIARLNGNWGERSPYSEIIDKWVDSVELVPGKELEAKAMAAIDKIMSEKSELAELWEENEDWVKCMMDLRRRIPSSPD